MNNLNGEKMICIKVPIEKTEIIRQYLADKKLLLRAVEILKEKKFAFLAIKQSADKKIIKDKFPFINFTRKSFQKIEKKTQHKQRSQIKNTISGYDVIGNIAIIEVPKNLEKGEKRIAKTILSTHKNIATVLKKKGGHEGVFRLQKFVFLAGKNKRETTHKEHGCLIKLDVEKVYFSPRLSTERKRIFSQVKKGESVLVMFSGSGAYPITVAKNSKAKEIHAIELNPIAHKYAIESLGLNKLKNVKCLLGDVRKLLPKLKKKFDRIVMPLPKDAGSFLGAAFKAAKKGTIIHLYDFFEEAEKGEKPGFVFNEIKKACKLAKHRCKILSWNKCGQVGMKTYRICVDFKILKI